MKPPFSVIHRGVDNRKAKGLVLYCIIFGKRVGNGLCVVPFSSSIPSFAFDKFFNVREFFLQGGSIANPLASPCHTKGKKVENTNAPFFKINRRAYSGI